MTILIITFYLLLQNLNDQRLFRSSEYLESNNLHLWTLSHLRNTELQNLSVGKIQRRSRYRAD
uniref:Uncharacterized protein n=1 Tax=Myoviridae sp. ctBtT5 TaxID=2825048 RepID=A0A8S5PY41_9CAUD|nr:MAG TPA: hypothetical protein [Myoviridae sp. ctBtT5]